MRFTRYGAVISLTLALTFLFTAMTRAQASCSPVFPQGSASFADEVAAFQRGTFGTSGQPGNALGSQNVSNGSVTLGNGGTLTIQFTDNVLTGSGSSDPDLYIFESGPLQELVTVEVSANGSDFFTVGQTSGQCGFIDLDAFGFGPADQFFYVRVTDLFDDQYRENSSAGAEINAIGAISTAVLELPHARNDAYTADQDTTLSVGGGNGVLANDDDPGGEAISVIDFTQPEHGTVAVNPNGSFDYTPEPGFTGSVSFRYTITNESGLIDSATVTIDIQPDEKNDPPVTEDDRYDVDQDESTHVDRDKGVLENDEDPDGDDLTAAVDEPPHHGHVEMNDNGAFTYTPDPGFHGGDVFIYWARDGHGNRTRGRVNIHVSQVEHRDDPGLAVAGDGGVTTTTADGGAVVAGEATIGEGLATELAAADAAMDEDGDGLTSDMERTVYGTDPWLWDSDSDGVSDGDEVLRGANPLGADNVNAALADDGSTAPNAAAPESNIPAVEPVPNLSTGAAPGEGDAGASVMTGCGYADWLTAQSAYAAAGRTSADSALVNAVDPDWDSIACEEGLQP